MLSSTRIHSSSTSHSSLFTLRPRTVQPRPLKAACQETKCSRPAPGFCRQTSSIRSRSPRVQAKRQQFATFDEMLSGSDQPVLVDFSARWCGPCQMMSGVLAVLAKRLQPHCKVVKIDTDKYPNLASRNQIQALPTLVLFQNGKPIDRIEGFMNEMQLLNRVQKALGQ